MKCLKKVHVFLFAYFEHQIRCRVVKFVYSAEKIKWLARQKRITIV